MNETVRQKPRGAAIAAAAMERLFDPRFRGGATTRPRFLAFVLLCLLLHLSILAFLLWEDKHTEFPQPVEEIPVEVITEPPPPPPAPQEEKKEEPPPPEEKQQEKQKPPPPPPPPPPVRVGGNIKPPAKVKHVNPVYPPIAQSARVQGVVIIEATIGPDGAVKDARVLRSIPLLDASALEAVRQWQFTPTLLNGVPVPVIMTVTVQFTLQ